MTALAAAASAGSQRLRSPPASRPTTQLPAARRFNRRPVPRPAHGSLRRGSCSSSYELAGRPGLRLCLPPALRHWRVAAAAAEGEASADGIGLDGLKEFLEDASTSLGHCRFIVANMASGGILEAVHDFGVAPLRYSKPTERGAFATLGTDTFECHVNIARIKKIAFATKDRPQREGDTAERAPMYIIRFLDESGASALSVVLHCGNGTDYSGDGSGRPEGWEQLKQKYGGAVDI